MGRVMIHQKHRLSLRQLIAAGHVLLILTAPPLRAQGSLFVYGAGTWDSGTVQAGSWLCGVSGSQFVPGPTLTASCNGGPKFSGFNGSVGRFDSVFQTDATATAANGWLKARSSVSWFMTKDDDSPVATFPRTVAGGEATARWDDRAHFLPVGPVAGLRALRFMDIQYRVDGQITGVEGLNYADPNNGTTWVGNATGQVNFTAGTQASSFFANQTVRLGRSTSATPAIPQFHTLRVGISGLSSDPFLVLLGTQAIASINGFFVGETFQGFMDSAFNNTATPVSYSLWDDLGTDVTSRYAVTFDQGLTFESQTVVPEPSTLLLLAGGLLALVVSWRRKVHTECHRSLRLGTWL